MPYDPSRHGPRRIVGPGFLEQVHEAVRALPPGAVASYGDIAARLGNRNVARHVGWALAALPDGTDVPWWRVVDSTGRFGRRSPELAARQGRLLEGEGVEVKNGRVRDFARCRLPAAP